MLPPHIKLHKVEVADALSQETLAFTAELHLYGNRAASIRNDGCGGSHVIRFDDPVLRSDFERTVATWAEDEHVTLEPADRLINALLDRYEISAAAREFSRRGRVGRVVCVRKTPVRLASEPDGYPLGYEQSYLLAVPQGSSAAEVAESEGADTYLSYTFATSRFG